MPDTLHVRDATAADMTAVTAIYAREVETGFATYEEEAPSVEEMTARRQQVLEAGLPYLVGLLDGDLAGYSYARRYHTRSAYRFTVESTIYVAPAYHRRGVGAALMRELITRCETGGQRQMLAVIGDPDAGASVALHRRLGFSMVGRLEATGFKFGRWVDTAIMQRALGQGAAAPPLD